MKVLLVNTSDKGGAATAITRIHLGLLKAGAHSRLLLLYKSKDIPESFQYRPRERTLPQRILSKIKRFISGREKDIAYHKQEGVEWFSSPKSPYDITTHPLYEEADLILLNWVSRFLDEPSFFRKNTKPVFWRMPDLYCCGGGYHYEKGFPFDALGPELRRNTRIRERALSGTKVHYVAISEWVRQKANDSSIVGGNPVSMIHNGIDPKQFKPHDPKSSRKAFSLPEDKIIVLMGADKSSSYRKGSQLAVDALELLDNPRVQPVVFGQTEFDYPSTFIKLDYIDGQDQLSRLYSSADLFLMTSVEEAFGQVTIEAMACGTPVISFPNGGSVDIIKDGVNGVLAKDFTARSLKEALYRGMGLGFDREEIVATITKGFLNHQKVEQYMELFQQAIVQSEEGR